MKAITILTLCLFAALATCQNDDVTDPSFSCDRVDFGDVFHKCRTVLSRLKDSVRMPNVTRDDSDVPTREPTNTKRDIENYQLSDFVISQGHISGVCAAAGVCATAFKLRARQAYFCSDSDNLRTAIRMNATVNVTRYSVKRVLNFLRDQCYTPPAYPECPLVRLAVFAARVDVAVKRCIVDANILTNTCSERCSEALESMVNVGQRCLRRPAVRETLLNLKPIIERRATVCDKIDQCQTLRTRVGTLLTRCASALSGGTCTPACIALRKSMRGFINRCVRVNPVVTNLLDTTLDSLKIIDKACNFVRQGELEVNRTDAGRLIRVAVRRAIDFPGRALADCVSDVKSSGSTTLAPVFRCAFEACKDKVEERMDMIFDRISDCADRATMDVDACAGRDLLNSGTGQDSIDLGRADVNADLDTGAAGNGAETEASIQELALDDGCRVAFRQRVTTSTVTDPADGAPLGIGVENVIALHQCVKRTNASTRILSLHVRCNKVFAGDLEDDPDNAGFVRIRCGCGVFRAKKTATCISWDGVEKQVDLELRLAAATRAVVDTRHGAMVASRRLLALLPTNEDCAMLEWDPSVSTDESNLDTTADNNDPSPASTLITCMALLLLCLTLLI